MRNLSDKMWKVMEMEKSVVGEIFDRKKNKIIKIVSPGQYTDLYLDSKIEFGSGVIGFIKLIS
jgi:hypothetical protein